MRVLLIEDYLPLVKSVSQGLREAGYAVDTATDGEMGLECAEAQGYDAVILDLMLPKVDGLIVLKRLRTRKNAIPVLILTARDAIDDRVKGLDLGADDYLAKPFAFQELLARVRAIIRRRYQSSDSTIRVGNLEIDQSARTVRREGAPIVLSAREYALLEYLAARRGQVASRAEIWDHVYDFASEPSSNVVDVYIGYLRKKIEQGEGPKLIHTRRGQGYVLGESE
ncbi:MAG TPA: response regulator transcription factor [Polyangia bacterium]|jgi:DNA-binding response OmpR family regulator|nr:response regulator transcription factor [Polyangia bacterium]